MDRQVRLPAAFRHQSQLQLQRAAMGGFCLRLEHLTCFQETPRLLRPLKLTTHVLPARIRRG
jgi:hypothetical protein